MLTIFKYLMYLNSNFLTLKIVLKSKLQQMHGLVGPGASRKTLD